MFMLFLSCTAELSEKAPIDSAEPFVPESFIIKEGWLNLKDVADPTIRLPGQTDNAPSLTLEFFSPEHPYGQPTGSHCQWIGAFTHIDKDQFAPYWRGDAYLETLSHDCDSLLGSKRLSVLNGSRLTIELEPLLDSQKNTLKTALASAGQQWSEYQTAAIGVRVGLFYRQDGPLIERQWGVVYPTSNGEINSNPNGTISPGSAGQYLSDGALRFFSMAPIEMTSFPNTNF